MYGRANWNEIKCFVNLANVKTHTLLHVPQVSFLNSNLYCHYQLTFNNKTIHTANQKLYKFLTFNFIFHNLFISKYCNNYNCTVMQIRHCNCIVISTYPSSATPLCCCILVLLRRMISAGVHWLAPGVSSHFVCAPVYAMLN